MSKIAENKALEAYPEIEGSETYFDRDYICTKPIDLNKQRRQGYIKGYDQAVQDFMEKAISFIRNCTTYDGLGYKAKCVEIEQFKNYMQN